MVILLADIEKGNNNKKLMPPELFAIFVIPGTLESPIFASENNNKTMTIMKKYQFFQNTLTGFATVVILLSLSMNFSACIGHKTKRM